MIFAVTWLWQGLALAAAATVALACARRLNAATRHVIWWLTGAAIVALPVTSWTLWSAAAAADGVPTEGAFLVPAPPDWMLPSAFLGWTLFAAAGVVRVGASLRALVRLKRTGEPLAPAIAARLAEWRSAAAARPGTELRVTERIRGACALGLGRPVILVSRALVDALDSQELDAIVMHERAHLERRDDRWQLVQALVGAVAGWHPALWYVGRRIHLEREAACDDHVVARTRAARTYARALVRAAGVHLGGIDPVGTAIPGASVSPSVLRTRVRRLLDPSVDRSPAPTRFAGSVTAAALVAGLLVIGRVPAIVAFVEVEAGLPRVAAAPRDAADAPLRPVMTAGVETARRQPAREGRRAANVHAGAPASARPAEPLAPPLAEAAHQAPPDAAAGAVLSASPIVIRDTVTVPPPRAPDDPGRWSAFARFGSSTGERASAAGVSIGRFFTRAGKGVAGRF